MSIRFFALALGLAGWLTYLILWLGVRLFGAVTLRFDIWEHPWVRWFELWIEPVVLVGILALIGWALWRDLVEAVHRAGRDESRSRADGS